MGKLPLFNRTNLSWARLVSNLLSPPVVWAVMAFPIAFRDAASDEQALTWALVYTGLVCLLPVIYIAWMVHRGSITDLHMEVREERIRPFVVSIICTTIAWWVLRFMGAPPIVPLFALFSLVQIAVMLLITLVWQISIHVVSISGAVIAALVWFGPLWALLVIPLVILVGAARLKLHRHTLAQVLVGSLVGIIVPALLLAAAT
jgi:hypothetical protein